MTNSEPIRAVVHARPVATRRMLRTIAVFEAVKGIAALAAVVGILDLMHHDVRHLAIELIGHFHLRPDAHYSSILLHYADLLPNADLRSLMLLASAYIAVRVMESYGLWTAQAWGEWLGTLSGALYVPFELAHQIHRPSLVTGLVLAGNLFLVAFLAVQLWRRHHSVPKQVV